MKFGQPFEILIGDSWCVQGTIQCQNKPLFKNWMAEWLHVNPILWLEKVRGLTVICTLHIDKEFF